MKKKATKKKVVKKGRRKKKADQLKADVAVIAEILSLVALNGEDHSDDTNAEIIEGWRNRLIEIRNRWSYWSSPLKELDAAE